MRRAGVLRALAIVLLVGVACRAKADGPPHIEVDRTACNHCGMLVSETTFAAAFAAPAGEPRVFDDIGCLIAAAKREANPAGLRFWFHDATSGAWIDGTEATFVKSERFRTPMSGGLLAYRDPAAAGRSAAESQGVAIRTLTELLSQREH